MFLQPSLSVAIDGSFHADHLAAVLKLDDQYTFGVVLHAAELVAAKLTQHALQLGQGLVAGGGVFVGEAHAESLP